jgi:hypothetical protein
VAGFVIRTVSGDITLQASQRSDGSWVQEVDASPAKRVPVGPPEKLVIGTGAVVSLSPPAGATEAEIFLESASDIRYYDDGSTPTTGVSGNGATIPANGAAQVNLVAFTNWKMIAITASVNAQVLYYRGRP